MNEQQTEAHQPAPHHHPGNVEVQVVTTSGTYPENGEYRAPVTQPVKVVLEKAQEKLEIADTSNWIATVGGDQIDAAKSYTDNHLSGHVKIDWGPREGGGGKGVHLDA